MSTEQQKTPMMTPRLAPRVIDREGRDGGGEPAGTARVPGPDVSVVIASFNTKTLLRRCLESLRRHAPKRSCEVLVVDDASRDGTATMVRVDFPWIRLLVNQANLGYARSNNLAIEACRGRFIYLLNSDAEVRAGTIDHLCDFLDSHPHAGAAGSLLENADGSLQASAKAEPSFKAALFGKRSVLARWFPKSAAVRAELLQWRGDGEEPFEVGYISSASLMIPKRMMGKVGALDVRFWHFIDADYCRRIAKAGGGIYCVPRARAIHREHRGGTLGDTRHRFRSVWTFHYGAYLYFKRHGNVSVLHPLHWAVLMGLGSRLAVSLVWQVLKEMSGIDQRRYGV